MSKLLTQGHGPVALVANLVTICGSDGAAHTDAQNDPL